MRKLLATEELGDRKPSALLRDMLTRGGNQATQQSDFVKQPYLDKLPVNIRNILAPTQNSVAIEILAQQADQIYESGNHSPTQQVHAINATPNTQNYRPQSNNQEAEITLLSIFKIVTKLSVKVATLEGQVKYLNNTARNTEERGRMQFNNNANQPRDRSQSNNRNQYNANYNRSNQNNGTASTLCWHHEKYAEKALRCGGNCTCNANTLTQGNSNPGV
jgi:hypothetical protein